MELQVIFALILAVFTALYIPQVGWYVAWMGNLFMTGLKVFLGPLLFFSILSAVLGMWDIGRLGKIGGRTFGYYFITTTLAIITSLILLNIFQPWNGLELGISKNFVPWTVEKLTFTSFILWLIPNNIFQAFVEVNAMQIVTMALLFGICVILSAKGTKKIKELNRLIDIINGGILTFIGLVIKLTPFWVFGIVTNVIIIHGFQSLVNLFPFVLIVLLWLIIHAVISLPLLAYAVAKVDVFGYFKYVREALLVGFSTSSSSATMPVSMRVTRENAHLREEVVNFSFPIGATVNMDGTALYQAAVAIFISQVLGIDLGLVQQLTIIVIIIMASIWAAGVPWAGIIILATVFLSIWLPLEAIGIILAVDRILDMFRTTVNVWGDLITAKVVNTFYERSLE